MKTPRFDIASTIAAHTYYRGTSKAYARQIAAMLLHEGRVNELDSLLRDVQADWATHGYVEVLATSAHPLTGALRSYITKQVKRFYPQAKQITVTEIHDPAVIGGVRLDFADRQLDLSIENKLRSLKQLTNERTT